MIYIYFREKENSEITASEFTNELRRTRRSQLRTPHEATNRRNGHTEIYAADFNANQHRNRQTDLYRLANVFDTHTFHT